MIELLEKAGGAIGIVLAIAAYMVAVWVATEFLKPVLKIDGGKALGLAWAVGLLLYGVLALAGCYAVTWASVFIFIVLTGLCNGVYKWTELKKLLAPARRLGGGE